MNELLVQCFKEIQNDHLRRFLEVGDAPQVAENEGLWGDGHYKAIHPWKPPPAGIKPRSLKRNPVGYHFGGQIGEGGGGGALGRADLRKRHKQRGREVR